MRRLATRMAAIALVLAGAPVVAATIAFSDAFDRADGSTLGNGWQEVAGDLLIQSGELRSAAGLGGSSVAVQPALASDAQSVAATFASASNNSIAALGLVLRHQNAQNHYALYRLTGGTSVLRISAIVNGQEFVLGQTGVPNPSENVLFKLSASAQGATLSLTLEGVKTLSVNDARFAQGTVGLPLGNRTTRETSKRLYQTRERDLEIASVLPPKPLKHSGLSLASEINTENQL